MRDPNVLLTGAPVDIGLRDASTRAIPTYDTYSPVVTSTGAVPALQSTDAGWTYLNTAGAPTSVTYSANDLSD